ncbi:MAG TPA: ATP-binding protein [Geminicoccus sp.]|uniref:hybrid sensor histidine kinase/response regulator n=1 Tax=Geminicoccus sp. TaxID=2024832 RepID=UPI002B5BF4C5|nr:ATP-binding protein [Geminicoccus sp.]HWL68471.1 ATP-binding protein [Geminicoccus sp.]
MPERLASTQFLSTAGAQPAARFLAAIGVLALLAALATAWLAGPDGVPVLLNPVSAILLIGLLRCRPAALPAMVVLGPVAILAGWLLAGQPFRLSLEAALLHMLEAGLAAALLRYGNRVRIEQPADALWFGIVALLVPAFTTLGAIALGHFQGRPLDLLAACHAYAASTLGLLVLVPLVLVRGLPGWRLGAALLAVLLAAAAALSAATAVPPLLLHLPLLALPCLTLAALHLGLRSGLLLTLATAAGMSVVLMALDLGVAVPAGTVLAWQAYLLAAALAVLAAGVAQAERCRLLADLRAARQIADDARSAKVNFLSAMGHEFRTPITAVLGMVDLLDQSDLPAGEKTYLETIRTSGRHLLAIVNDLLDFSRSEAGRLQVDNVEFSLREILDQTRAFLTPQASELGLEFHFDVDEQLPVVVRGDPRRLRQVLLNLTGNALKFTNRGSVTVQMRHTVADGAVRLRVDITDTGIGMAPEKVARLFRSFDLDGTPTRRSHGGIGLGLAISKRLIEAMGGQIGVESTQGVGSRFWFEVTLPLGSAPNPVLLNASDLPPLRVLVADDGAVNRKLLLQMLSRYGHQVTSARNGVEAVEMVVRGQFDVVLMDIQMPVMDGIEATRLIRELPAPRNATPILGITASIMPEEYQRCLDVGMNRVLVKPLDWEQLFAVMAEHAKLDEADA